MRILSLDTATQAATCAVLEDDTLLGEIVFNYEKQHSIILLPMIDQLLKSLKLDIKSIDGFVVSSGPGSFTGLRIGAATIKGLCQSSDKPFIGVSTLDGLAYNMAFTSGLICPILDALRGNVYSALYSFENGKLSRHTEYLAISIDDLINLISQKGLPVTFIGDATSKFKQRLEDALPEVRFAPRHLNVAKASSLGELGLTLLLEGKKENLYTFSPEYLRKSQAEREYDEKMEQCKNE